MSDLSSLFLHLVDKMMLQYDAKIEDRGTEGVLVTCPHVLCWRGANSVHVTFRPCRYLDIYIYIYRHTLHWDRETGY